MISYTWKINHRHHILTGNTWVHVNPIHVFPRPVLQDTALCRADKGDKKSSPLWWCSEWKQLPAYETKQRTPKTGYFMKQNRIGQTHRSAPTKQNNARLRRAIFFAHDMKHNRIEAVSKARRPLFYIYTYRFNCRQSSL